MTTTLVMMIMTMMMMLMMMVMMMMTQVAIVQPKCKMGAVVPSHLWPPATCRRHPWGLVNPSICGSRRPPESKEIKARERKQRRNWKQKPSSKPLGRCRPPWLADPAAEAHAADPNSRAQPQGTYSWMCTLAPWPCPLSGCLFPGAWGSLPRLLHLAPHILRAC